MFGYKELMLSFKEAPICVGDPNQIHFDNAKSVMEANKTSICWIRDGLDVASTLKHSAANTIICSNKKTYDVYPEKVLILVDNPRLCFLQMLTTLFSKPAVYGIHPTAIIDKDAELAEQVYIGAHTIIGKSQIGHQTHIGPYCHIHDSVKIGKSVKIKSHCSIGGSGFGYERQEDLSFQFFPHLGGVIIEDHVDIGAHTCIDRGTLGNTLIGVGSKIDNLIHIAHNVQVGKHCAIIAHALIGGGVTIGDYCWIAPSATIRDGLKIGDHSVVGIGALVLKDIPANETWIGSPAKRYEKTI